MSDAVLFIKKGCSTCVDALKWLKANNVPVTVRDIFVEPLSKTEIVKFLGDRSTADLLSIRSPRFKSLGLDQRNMSVDEMVTVMADDPYLVRRPTLVIGDRMIIGFDKSAYAGLAG